MQNKLRQLVISALRRNEQTMHLPLSISVEGYTVEVSGEVASEALIAETIRTIELVSPHLLVKPSLTVSREPVLVK